MGSLVCAKCVSSQHTRVLLCVFLTKNISDLDEASWWEIWEPPHGLGDRTGSPQGLRGVGIGRRSPKLTRHAGLIWRAQLEWVGRPALDWQLDMKARVENQWTHRGVGGDAGADSTSFSFHVIFLHLSKSCNEAAYGMARLIVSFWPLREEGGKKSNYRTGSF